MRFTLLFILLFSIGLQAQSKYFVYFKDKGVPDNGRLNKTTALYKAAEKSLSAKAIERRKRDMGEDNYITYQDLPLNESYVQSVRALGVEIRRELKWFNAVSCFLTDEQVNKLERFDFIKSVERMRSRRPRIVEENSFSEIPKIGNSETTLNYGGSFNQMNLSEVPPVHDIGLTGEGVIIGFIDAGFTWEIHESTQNLNVLWEYDFVDDDNDAGSDPNNPLSEDRHGTQTVSIACGYAPGNLIGPAYNADVMFAKTEDIDVEVNEEEDNFAAAVQGMENRGVDIITSSLGYLDFDPGQAYSYTHQDMDGHTSITTIAYELAAQRGVITVTSAGNEGAPTTALGGVSAPADGELTISVGNVSIGNVVQISSSRGPTADGRIKPEVVALGSNVRAVFTTANSYVSSANGTSYAAPIVAGIIGQLKEAFPHLTVGQTRQILKESSDNKTSPDNDRGWGLLSAKQAVCYPNLEKLGNGFKLHKIFIHSEGVNASSIQLKYRVNSGSETNTGMQQVNSNKFYYNLPSLNVADKVEFYFTYTTTNGTNVREPATGYYESDYGDLHVNGVTGIEDYDLPSNYHLSNNYPNPFNGQTRINFTISQKENVRLVIYNALGELVKTLYDDIADAGTLTLSWNGTNNMGSYCASGTYYLVLYTREKVLSNKMIFLK